MATSAAMPAPASRPGRPRGAHGPLLTSKITVPGGAAWLVPRPRVEKLIAQGAEGPVTTVAGPPGAGKTMALALWAGGRAPAGPGLRLVVSSRMDPLFPLHRYRLTGELTEIRAGDLAFTVPEARLLMAQHGITLSAQALERLTRRAEGWAAIMRLAAATAPRPWSCRSPRERRRAPASPPSASGAR